MKKNQETVFATVEGFLAWLMLGGKAVKFPYLPDQKIEKGIEPPPNVWMLEIESGKAPRIASGYYSVESLPPYGAPKIKGICYPFAGSEASGIIQFSFKDDVFQKIDRRRLTASDQLSENEELVCISNDAALDRLLEPVAIVVPVNVREKIAALSDKEWLVLFLACRDGVELDAVKKICEWSRG